MRFEEALPLMRSRGDTIDLLVCDVNAPPQWKNLYTKNEPEAAAAPPPEMAE